jgi:hypothetical protein
VAVWFRDDLFDLVQEVMILRTKDKVAQTRAMAVWALSRLQIFSDPSCPVTAVFKQLLDEDPSQYVQNQYHITRLQTNTIVWY